MVAASTVEGAITVDGELVFGLVGNPVAIAGVVVGGSGRDIIDHGDGGLKAAWTAC